MGYNSVLFLCNDHFAAIDADPAGWWEKTKEMLGKASREPVEYGFGHAGNGFWAVSNMHSNGASLVATGQNHVTVLVPYFPTGHHLPEEQAKLLGDAARRIGFRLARLPKLELRMEIKMAEHWLAGKHTVTSSHAQRREKERVEWLSKLVALPNALLA